MNNNEKFEKIVTKRFLGVSETDIPPRMEELLKEQIPNGNGIYIWGGPGTGKTHLAYAMAKRLIGVGFEIMFFNTGDLLEKMREEFNSPSRINEESDGLFRDIMNFKKKGCVLILDDIGTEKGSEWVKERLYLLINQKYEDMTPIIFTSNLSLEQLSDKDKLGDRIASRIRGMTHVVEKTGVDRRDISTTKN